MEVKFKIVYLIISILVINCSSRFGFTEEIKLEDLNKGNQTFNHNLGDDLITTGKYALQGSYKQFSSTSYLIIWGMAAGSAYYLIENDKRLSRKAINNNKNEKIFNVIGDASILFNTPILPAIFYSISLYRSDEKMLRFSQEYTATLGLGLFESLFLSAIPIHKRPDEKKLTVWEEAFRGRSSFPSGHVVGLSALGFKAFQFYGPVAGIPPLLLAAVTGFQRVHTEKHYYSDVVASFFISFLASEGVRVASGYDNNHPLYKWIWEHNFNIGYIRQSEIPGVQVSFLY